jgi:hypothetical protein
LVKRFDRRFGRRRQRVLDGGNLISAASPRNGPAIADQRLAHVNAQPLLAPKNLVAD